MPHQLDRLDWTDADFDQMGWHDAFVHAIGVLPEHFELVIDLDYILRWEQPAASSAYYTFWVAPATLVFRQVSDVHLRIDAQNGAFSILDLHRRDPMPPPNGAFVAWHWHVDGDLGEARFQATGYTQHCRRQPQRTDRQYLTDAQRGGLSFQRETTASERPA